MTTQSDKELQKEFGPEAVFSRVGDITIVHLDRPTEVVVRERIEEVRRETVEPADCPLCEMERVKGGQTVVYDREIVWKYSKVQPWAN